MRVLVGCECSQTVTAAFREKGHDAFSCDISPSYGDYPEFHLQGDLHEVYDYVKPDLFIAHPPCTYLSKAGSVRLFSSDSRIKDYDRFQRGLAARDFFLWCLSRSAPMVCVENPIPLHVFCLPRPTQIIQPYYFGDRYSKATCLWLKGLPELPILDFVKPVGSWTALHKSPRIRSKTFPGVARAMADTWGSGDLVGLQYSLFDGV